MTYVDHAPSRQITGVLAVVAIHAAIILALMNGLVARIQPIFKPETEVFFVATEKAKPEPVVQPDQVIPDVPVVEPVELPPIDIQPQQEVIELPPVEIVPQASSTGTAISEPSPLQVDPNKTLTRPEYPATSIRLNEQGKVLLLIYVLPNGKVGDVKVSRSSGYPRLDASAMREAKRSWRFLPAKDGSGSAVAAWGTFEVAFQLND
jgi:protein TonB